MFVQINSKCESEINEACIQHLESEASSMDEYYSKFKINKCVIFIILCYPLEL